MHYLHQQQVSQDKTKGHVSVLPLKPAMNQNVYGMHTTYPQNSSGKLNSGLSTARNGSTNDLSETTSVSSITTHSTAVNPSHSQQQHAPVFRTPVHPDFRP